jgi:thiamine-phosphate pyrophosphorylase
MRAAARLPRLWLITDDEACARWRRGVVETVTRALSDPRGRPLHAPQLAVLVRMKGAPLDEVSARCRALLPVVRRAGARLLVHTHVPLVARLSLDGVHLPDAPRAGAARVEEARLALPPGALVGVSCHRAADVDDDAEGADYAFLSPVFAPLSKPTDVRPPLGEAALASACRRHRTPMVALGGIDTAARCALVRRAGAVGAAVLGAVMAARDPTRAVAPLLAAAAEARGR